MFIVPNDFPCRCTKKIRKKVIFPPSVSVNSAPVPVCVHWNRGRSGRIAEEEERRSLPNFSRGGREKIWELISSSSASHPFSLNLDDVRTETEEESRYFACLAMSLLLPPPPSKKRRLKKKSFLRNILRESDVSCQKKKVYPPVMCLLSACFIFSIFSSPSRSIFPPFVLHFTEAATQTSKRIVRFF